MFWRIEVENKPQFADPVGMGIKKDIKDLGYGLVSDVRMIQVYILESDITKDKVEKIATELLSDNVIQKYKYGSLDDKKFDIKQKADIHVVEIAYNPGVMDPWEESIKKGIIDLKISGVKGVKTGRKYVIKGKLTQEKINIISEKLLYNKVIQHVVEVKNLKKTLLEHKDIGYEFKKSLSR